MPFFLLLLVGGAVAAAVALFGYIAEAKRRELLAQYAASKGLPFDPEKDRSHDSKYQHFEVFRRGHSRAAYNTMRGSLVIEGRTFPMQMGDFTYKITSGSGKSRSTRTYHFSYLILDVPFPVAHSLLIRPERFFDRLLGAVGFEDINFESAEFSRKFFVKSSDRRVAYDVVHPRLMEFLLQSPPPVIDIEWGECCLTDGRNRWEPHQVEQQIAFATRFFELWPNHLVADLEAGAR